MLFYAHNVIKLLFVNKTEPYELNWIEISKSHVGTYIPTCSDCISLWIRLMLPEKKKENMKKQNYIYHSIFHLFVTDSKLQAVSCLLLE